MLNYAFRIIIKRNLTANFLKSRINFFKIESLKSKSYLKNQQTFFSIINNLYLFHYALNSKKQYLSNKVSAIFYGGMLTSLNISNDENIEPSYYEAIKAAIFNLLGFQTQESEDSELILRIKKGILFIKRKQYDKGEEMLHSALKLAQELKDEDGITYVYDILANLTFETNQYEKAEKLFVSTIQRLLAKGEEKDSNKIVEISLKLAKIFENINELKKAEQGYKFCIESLDKKLDTQDQDTLALWGMSMDWYARFLLKINKASDSLNCLKKAYEMCVKLNGLEHDQTVVLLNDLGTVSTILGDYESGIHYFEKAKDLGKKLQGMNDFASIYINLGQLYLLREMIKESKEACQEGLKLAKQQEDDTAIFEAKQCLDKIKNAFKYDQHSKKPETISSTPLPN